MFYGPVSDNKALLLLLLLHLILCVEMTQMQAKT